MCRFIIYCGQVVKLSSVLMDAPHSLIRQTFHRHLPTLTDISEKSKSGSKSCENSKNSNNIAKSQSQNHSKTQSIDSQLDEAVKRERSRINALFSEYDFEAMSRMNLVSLLNLSKVNALLNADGFGIGFFLPKKGSTDDHFLPVNHYHGFQSEPIVYNSLRPAWSDRNLRRLAPRMKSGLIFGHIRAASVGSAVSEYNTHPFSYGNFLFMHNGGVSKWSTIKRKVLNFIPQHLYEKIEGTTDSETIFFLYLSFLPQDTNLHTRDVLKSAMRKTIQTLTSLSIEAQDSTTVGHDENSQSAGLNKDDVSCAVGAGEDMSGSSGSSLNFALTNGITTIVTRYRNHSWESPPSLYIAHNVCVCENGDGETSIREPEKGDVLSTIIASEPLTYENLELWHIIPKNTMVLIDDQGLDVERLVVGTSVEKSFKKWATISLNQIPLTSESSSITTQN